MGEQYGQLPDLPRFLATTTHLEANLVQPQHSEVYNLGHRNVVALAPYHEAFMVSSRSGMAPVMDSGLIRNMISHDPLAATNCTTGGTSASSASGACAPLIGVPIESRGWGLLVNMDGGNSRWPRQETLTLLDIRSRLDSKFKEANQKGPLWDEVSRIMGEEYGYQRSGKKCREKFENLYKYYKKTKEGKAGRQDGKNYRFFRQLEALCGETSNQSCVPEANLAQRNSTPLWQTQTAMNQEDHLETLQEQKLVSESFGFSVSDASEFETSSSKNNDDHDHEDLSTIAFMMKQSKEKHKSIINESCRVKRGWKTKVKDFVEWQMKKLIDSQDVWMEKMLKTIEDKEQERMSKDEEWRRQEAARFHKEQRFWANERAWFEAHNAELMEVLNKFTGKGLEVSSLEEETVPPPPPPPPNSILMMMNKNKSHKDDHHDIINTNTTTPPNKAWAWNESLGYEREGVECQHKWDNMQRTYLNLENVAECYNNKRKEDYYRSSSSSSSKYFDSFNNNNNNNNNTNNQTVKQKMDQLQQ